MIPKKVTKQELLDVLIDMVERVSADDSFEGSVEWTCMEDGLEAGEFMARAFWRVGNRDGQGGACTVGTVEDQVPEARRYPEPHEVVARTRTVEGAGDRVMLIELDGKPICQPKCGEISIEHEAGGAPRTTVLLEVLARSVRYEPEEEP